MGKITAALIVVVTISILLTEKGQGKLNLKTPDPTIESICRLDMPEDPLYKWITIRIQQEFYEDDYDDNWGPFTREGYVKLQVNHAGAIWDDPYEIQYWYVPVEPEVEHPVGPAWEGVIRVHWSRSFRLRRSWEDDAMQADIRIVDGRVIDRWHNPVCSSLVCGRLQMTYPFFIMPGEAQYNSAECTQLEDLDQRVHIPSVIASDTPWGQNKEIAVGSQMEVGPVPTPASPSTEEYPYPYP